MRYFDTGVLLKLYLPEKRSAEAVDLVRSAIGPPPFTRLHGLEMRAALRQKTGRGEISEDESRQLFADLEADLLAGVHVQPAVNWQDVFDHADALTATHGAATLCRSLDTLHVALAITLGATEFCTFDKRQAKMAVAAGLFVVPDQPETDD